MLLKIAVFPLFSAVFWLGVQNEPITAAVQPTPHIRATAIIDDLVAVADVEAGERRTAKSRVERTGKKAG